MVISTQQFLYKIGEVNYSFVDQLMIKSVIELYMWIMSPINRKGPGDSAYTKYRINIPN